MTKGPDRDHDPISPPLDELADEDDQLGWDREKHGTFADHAAPDDAVQTVPADEYLNSSPGNVGNGGDA